MSKERTLVAVVDDEEPVRIALWRLLRSAGLEVETFSTGTEFLESLKAHRPDCVVLDLNMPQLNGFAVLARLVEAGVRLPLVVLTGQDTPEAQARALAGGAACYLRKPADDQKLLNSIFGVIQHMAGGAPPAAADTTN